MRDGGGKGWDGEDGGHGVDAPYLSVSSSLSCVTRESVKKKEAAPPAQTSRHEEDLIKIHHALAQVRPHTRIRLHDAPAATVLWPRAQGAKYKARPLTPLAKTLKCCYYYYY